MNTFATFGTDAVAAEAEYRRAVLTVAAPRRARRVRRVAR
jgi:hypothetical protein